MATTMLKVMMAGLFLGFTMMVMVETSAFVQAPSTPIQHEVASFSNPSWVFGATGSANERITPTFKRQTRHETNARHHTSPLFATVDSSEADNEFAGAMNAYMTKTHEEKLETQALLVLKDAEIEALKAQLNASGTASSDGADVATKLAAYQKYMADYIVKATEEQAAAVARAETAEAALQQLQKDAGLPPTLPTTTPAVATDTQTPAAAADAQTAQSTDADGNIFYELGQAPRTVGADAAASASGQWTAAERDRIRDGVYDGPGATLPPTVVSRDNSDGTPQQQQQVNPTTVPIAASAESEPSLFFYDLGEASTSQTTASADAAARASGVWSSSEMDRIRDGVYEGPGATLPPTVASNVPPQEQVDSTTFAAATAGATHSTSNNAHTFAMTDAERPAQ